MIDSANHVTVVSAMSRLARCGGWARLLEGKPLEDELDLLDAELLVQAGVLARQPDDSLRPTEAHPWFFDPAAMAAGTVSLLRQALDHAEGRVSGWSGHDPATLLAQGVASSSASSRSSSSSSGLPSRSRAQPPQRASRDIALTTVTWLAESIT